MKYILPGESILGSCPFPMWVAEKVKKKYIYIYVCYRVIFIKYLIVGFLRRTALPWHSRDLLLNSKDQVFCNSDNYLLNFMGR